MTAFSDCTPAVGDAPFIAEPQSAALKADQQRAWVFGLLLLLTLVVYGGAFRNGFVWNDRDYVTAPGLRSMAGLVRIWTELGATEQYYPLLHSTFWLEHKAWGDSATGYHVINALWHGLSACLLFEILRRLSIRGATFAACLFVVHPVAVESVAWISEQKNTLSTMFYLAGLLAYLRFDAGRKRRWYAVATLLFILGLLTKSVTATLPAALLVIIWWQRGALTLRRDVVPLLPWLLTGAAMGLFSGWVERRFLGADGDDFLLTPPERFLIAGRALWFYLANTVWPNRLTFMYPRWHVSAAAMWQYLFPLSAGAALVALWQMRRWSRAPLTIALLFGGLLFPTLGFMNVYAFVFSFVADHWQYLALLPILVAFGSACGRWYEQAGGRRAAAVACAVFVVASLGTITWQQTRMYRSEETLYRETIARNPDAWLAHNNLGVILANRRQSVAAFREYATALALHPSSPELQNNLGNYYANQPGGTGEALAHYNEALRLKPTFADAHSNLSALLLKLPDHGAEALVHAERAARLKPDSASARYNLANALRTDPRRANEAIAAYESALRLDPMLIEAQNNLGTTLLAMGRFEEAARHFAAAIQQRGDSPELHFNLGRARAGEGRPDEAAAEFAAALDLQPHYPDADRELGALLLQAGRASEALPRLRAAVETNHADCAARTLLGIALVQQGAAREAADEFDGALACDPQQPIAHYNLANLLREIPERTADAIRHYKAAVQQAPDFLEAHFNLAVALLSDTGHREEAVEQLRIALRLKPDLQAARDLLERLGESAP